MKIDAVKLVYFSPTGTTRAVAEGIARGVGAGSVAAIDLTPPKARRRPLQTSEEELLVVAVPVYMGRVPALLAAWFDALEARQTPAVGVVVYGNRAYENALLELRDRLSSHGCIPVAGAAYIGEHSFSSAEIPVAPGRPDDDDLRHAADFGRAIQDKLRAVAAAAQLAELSVPGAYPYGGVTTLWDVDFIAVDEARCAQCGVCAAVCPMGAVAPDQSAQIDAQACITCCACIKRCPQQARTIKRGPVRDAALRLASRCGAPRQPERFL